MWKKIKITIIKSEKMLNCKKGSPQTWTRVFVCMYVTYLGKGKRKIDEITVNCCPLKPDDPYFSFFTFSRIAIWIIPYLFQFVLFFFIYFIYQWWNAVCANPHMYYLLYWNIYAGCKTFKILGSVLVLKVRQ